MSNIQAAAKENDNTHSASEAASEEELTVCSHQPDKSGI
jgi:hypothetical protein